jgi:LuxR family maltose regulon positive regulatory protein
MASALAMLRTAMLADGVAAAVGDAELAVAEEPVWSPWRSTALQLLYTARRVAGTVDDAPALLADMVDAAEANASTNLPYAISHRAAFWVEQGDWDQAKADLLQAEEHIVALRREEYVTSGYTYALLAREAAHRGHLGESRRYMTQAMRSLQLWTWAMPTGPIRVRLELARTHLALAQPGGAATMLSELEAILRHRPHLGTLVDDVERLRGQLAGARGAGPNAMSITTAELRLLPYLQTHITYPEIADRLYVTVNTVRTQARAVYRKLGVSSRSDAVSRAHELGLIG